MCCLSLPSLYIPWVSGETKLSVMISNILKQGWASSFLISSETVCCVRVFMSALADFHRSAPEDILSFLLSFFFSALCVETVQDHMFRAPQITGISAFGNTNVN